jgi:hypothetical protein
MKRRSSVKSTNKISSFQSHNNQLKHAATRSAPLLYTPLPTLFSHRNGTLDRCSVEAGKPHDFLSNTAFIPAPHTHKHVAAICVQCDTVFVSMRVLRPTSYTFMLQNIEIVHGCCSALQRVSTATGPYGSSGTVAVRAQVDMALETAGQQLWCETGCTLWRGNLHTTNQRVAASLRTHAAHALKRPVGGIQAGRRVSVVR